MGLEGGKNKRGLSKGPCCVLTHVVLYFQSYKVGPNRSTTPYFQFRTPKAQKNKIFSVQQIPLAAKANPDLNLCGAVYNVYSYCLMRILVLDPRVLPNPHWGCYKVCGVCSMLLF